MKQLGYKVERYGLHLQQLSFPFPSTKHGSSFVHKAACKVDLWSGGLQGLQQLVTNQKISECQCHKFANVFFRRSVA